MKPWKTVLALLLAAQAANAAMSALSPPAAGEAPAQESPPPEQPVLLHPQPEPDPALRYRLLPPTYDRAPGNAAILYERAIILAPQAEKQDGEMDRVVEWLKAPLDTLPEDEIRPILDKYDSSLHELEMASVRADCRWDLPIKEEGIALLLPELAHLRNLGRLLALRARLAIAQERYDDAIASLRVGFRMAHDLGHAPTLIHGLVGVAISSMMTDQIEALIQQPGSPNLYWALTILPSPLVAVEPIIETEMNMLFFLVPELKDVDAARRSPDEWRRLWQTLLRQLAQAGVMMDGRAEFKWQHEMAASLGGAVLYPRARQGLIEQGLPAEEVAAMSAPQVLVLYTVRTYRHFADRTARWFNLPYSEARPGIKADEKHLEREGRKREIIPLASMLLPALGAAQLRLAAFERRVATLRTFEALRVYAAAHAGALPEQLDQIAPLAVPMDPLTGQPVSYRREAPAIAVLDLPAPSGESVERYGKRYRITMQER